MVALPLERPFRGLISAPFMPMLPDESIDWASLRRYTDWIIAQKPDAVAVNMDAAEGPALTPAERIEVMRVCAEVNQGRVPLLSGLIGGSTEAMIAHGRDLVAAGAQGFCVFPPMPVFIGAPIPAEMIRRFHGDIADALRLPLIAFQFPRGWGPDYSGDMLAALASIDEIIAIKESSFDANQTIQAVENISRLERPIGILTGSDTFIYEAMLMGCDGALIGFAGTGVAELREMQQAHRDGDVAKGFAIWSRLAPLARYCWRPPIRDFRPRMKELLVMQGVIDHATVRRPQLGVSQAEREVIARLGSEAGLLR